MALLAQRANGLHERIRVLQRPVSAETGKPFRLPTNEPCTSKSGQFGLQRAAGGTDTAREQGVMQELVTVHLDGLISPAITRIDFVKIDVEGHEPYVLRGAMGLFARRVVRRASVECDIWRKWPDAADSYAVFARLYDYDYHIVCIYTGLRYVDKRDFLLRAPKEECYDYGLVLNEPEARSG